MTTKSGYLTIYSADRSELYGEFFDGVWKVEETAGGTNHILTGIASEGTAETFRRIDGEGIQHVSYLFEVNGYKYGGNAQLLALSESGGLPCVTIETGDEPHRV
jgi:hypothetical protein